MKKVSFFIDILCVFYPGCKGRETLSSSRFHSGRPDTVLQNWVNIQLISSFSRYWFFFIVGLLEVEQWLIKCIYFILYCSLAVLLLLLLFLCMLLWMYKMILISVDIYFFSLILPLYACVCECILYSCLFMCTHVCSCVSMQISV